MRCGATDRKRGMPPRFPPVRGETKHRDRFRRLLSENGVQTAVHYPVPIHFQEAYSHLGYLEGSFSVSERNAKEVVSLPCSPFTREDEIAYVAEMIRSIGHNIL